MPAPSPMRSWASRRIRSESVRSPDGDLHRSGPQAVTLAIAIEPLLFILGGILLAVALVYILGRPSKPVQPPGAPSVKLVRIPRTADGREETYLTVNDTIILTVSNEEVRLSEFADQLEQLEAIATRLATSMGVSVEFARAPLRGRPDEEAGIPMRNLPTVTDEQLDELTGRTRPDDANRRSGAEM